MEGSAASGYGKAGMFETQRKKSHSQHQNLSLPLIFTCLLVVPLCSCSDSTTSDRIVPPPSRMVVRPIDFLGDVYCGQEEAALSSYQTTLLDVSQSEDLPFALPSSKVVSCTSAVTFEAIEPGRRYVAVISAFEKLGLEPQSPGSPIVVDNDGNSVTPRWRSICWGENGIDYKIQERELLGEWGLESTTDDLESAGGAGGSEGAGSFPAIGATAYFNTAINVAGCLPLLDSGELGPTGVSVSLTQSLGAQECGSEGAQIASYQVTLRGAQTESEVTDDGMGGAANGEDTSCDKKAELLGLVPSQQVEVEVTATSADGLNDYFTVCRGFTRAGAVVETSCDPLQLTI